jgi:hypothetical protein
MDHIDKTQYLEQRKNLKIFGVIVAFSYGLEGACVAMFGHYDLILKDAYGRLLMIEILLFVTAIPNTYFFYIMHLRNLKPTP